MSDIDKSPEVPSTNNASVKDAEELWRECEARLKLVRGDIEKLLTNSPPATERVIHPQDEAKVRQAMDILSSLATDPFALIKRGVQDAQRDAQKETAPVAPGSNTPPNSSSAPLNSDGSKQTPADPASPNAVMPPTTSNTGVPASDLETQAQQIQDDTQTLSDASARVPSPAAQSGTTTPPNQQSFSSTSADFDGPAIQGAQATQASGERLRNALEQTTQFTASVFDQMLALVEGQNRKLGDVDRKIAQLSGQINSLKNP